MAAALVGRAVEDDPRNQSHRAGVSGRRSRMEAELAEQKRRLASLMAANRKVLLLKGDPEKAARPAVEHLGQAEARVAELAAERAVLESRVTELGILA